MGRLKSPVMEGLQQGLKSQIQGGLGSYDQV